MKKKGKARIMELNEHKARLRREVEVRRNGLTEKEHRERSIQICRRAADLLAERGIGSVTALEEHKPALDGQEPASVSSGTGLLRNSQPGEKNKAIFSYMPFGAEVDLFPLLEQLWREGRPVAAPLTLQRPKRLELHLVTGRDDLMPGLWSIPEPKPGTPRFDGYENLACVVMPGIGFDEKGGRLGYGGGFYDRFLHGLQEKGIPLPFRLALAFEIQLLDRIPMEAHDYRVNCIVTEERTIWCDNS